MTFDPKIYKDNGGDRLTVASGGTLRVQSGATFTVADGALAAGDVALAQGSVLVGGAGGNAAALSAKGDTKILVGNGTTITSVAVSGDATLANTGALTIAAGSVTPAMHEEQALSLVQIPLSAFKKDDLLTPLPNAGDSTNLGLVAGTHGTASPALQGADAGAATKTETARILIELPSDYVAAGDVKLRFHAGMLTTAADTSATLDVQAYETDEEAGVSADLCETAATTINSLTLADKDFVITGTDLIAGDILDVEITTVVTDGGDAGVMKAIIGAAKLLYDRK